MPIKGLTDGGDRFPIIGHIRKGAPKPANGRKPGEDLTYFRYVPVEGEEEAAGAFYSAYGDEPREISVFLPFDDIDRNFDAWMERHTAGALQCRGNGETVVMWRDGDGEMHHEYKSCPGNCDGCKATGRLRIIIPELRRLASVEVHTTAVWDIHELSGNLAALLRTEGRLTGIPLILKRRPREISTPRDGGKRVQQTKWLLSIEAAPRYVDDRLAEMEMQALPNGHGKPPALPEPAPEDDDIEDGEYTEAGSPAESGEPEDAERAALQAAMDYTTCKGTRLGDLTRDELNRLLDWATNNTGGETAQIAKHAPVLLDYLDSLSMVEDMPGSDGEELPF